MIQIMWLKNANYSCLVWFKIYILYIHIIFIQCWFRAMTVSSVLSERWNRLVVIKTRIKDMLWRKRKFLLFIRCWNGEANREVHNLVVELNLRDRMLPRDVRSSQHDWLMSLFEVRNLKKNHPWCEKMSLFLCIIFAFCVKVKLYRHVN